MVSYQKAYSFQPSLDFEYQRDDSVDSTMGKVHAGVIFCLRVQAM